VTRGLPDVERLRSGDSDAPSLGASATLSEIDSNIVRVAGLGRS
jgi:hypothetical protein